VQGTFQLNKTGDTYEFRVVVKEEAEQDEMLAFAMRIVAVAISGEVFGGAPVDVHLCDQNLKTKRVMEFEEDERQDENSEAPRPDEAA
jgi:hypothetical protein